MTSKPAFDPAAAARYIADCHRDKKRFENLPAHLNVKTVADAYAAQEALVPLWEPIHGKVAGLKIATTTKVMQQLMGIDHPCGGMIFERRIHASPARLKLADYIHLVVECELAVRVSRTLSPEAMPYTAATIRSAVAEVMPAFELIEDRFADYKQTSALSLIADAAWNAGIVLGKAVKVAGARELNGLRGRLDINGKAAKEGLTDGPMEALAWVANLANERGRPLKAGQVVITGSVIPTLPIASGDTFVFDLEGLGSAELSVT
jgi:2-keto-4-pentenoate hydratase